MNLPRAHTRSLRCKVFTLGLLLGSILLFSCTGRELSPSDPGPVSEQAFRLTEPNRLDNALVMTEEGWRFSGLLVRHDKGKGRLPFLLLLRAAPARAAAGPPPAALDALLLTETGIQLCAVQLDPESVTIVQALPGGADAVCRAAGQAVRALVLAPQPALGDKIKAGRKGPELHRGTGLIFRFSDSVLVEKESKTAGAWFASYGDHVLDNGFWLPGFLRYKDDRLELRLVRLMPGES